MKAVILAAGYATRLYPLTKDFPKPLLPVGGKTILDHLMAKIVAVNCIDEIFIITNHRFQGYFAAWAKQAKVLTPIVVVDDQTVSNNDRLGALADLQFVIDQAHLDDDLLVLAADNLFDFEITEMVAFYNKVGTDIITAYEVNDIPALQRTGVVLLDDQSRVLEFEEKPEHPRSNLAVPPFYIFKKVTVIHGVKQYLAAGNNPDAPGNFIPWLIQRELVHAYCFSGSRYDIGTLESYQAVQQLFEARSKMTFQGESNG